MLEKLSARFQRSEGNEDNENEKNGNDKVANLSRRRLLMTGATVATTSGLLVRNVRADPCLDSFQDCNNFVYSDYIRCENSVGDLQYEWSHEVEYQITTDGAEYVKSVYGYRTGGSFRYEGSEDYYYDKDDGFFIKAYGTFDINSQEFEPYIHIRVFDDGSARTEAKYGDCP